MNEVTCNSGIAGVSWHGTWERAYPCVIGAAAGAAWLMWGHDVVCVSNANGWHLDQMYTAVFGFTAVTTGYLATFYGTIQSMSSGFVHRIRGTRVLALFLKFIKAAIKIGFVCAVLSAVMMILVPLPADRYSWPNLSSAVWIFISVWAIVSFYRVASLLFFLFETEIPRERPGG